jgi:hypothetical protein
MKKHEVKVGTVYRVKVSGSVQDVRITGANPHGGWDGVNVATNRAVRIKSVQRLRAVAGERPAKRKRIVSLAEYEADAKAQKHHGPKAEPAGTTTAADVSPGSKKSAKAGKPAKDRKPAAPRKSLASAAVLVLAQAKEPMNAKAIVDAAVASGWYEPGKGKTPHATLYSSLLREARDDGDKGRFRKAKRGLWELTDAGKAEVDATKEALAAK